MKTLFSTCLAVALMSAGTAYAQQRAALGITMSDNSAGGVQITSVVAGGPAARLGLRSGDRILAVNNQPTDNYRDVMRIVGASRPNTTVELSVARGAWRGTLKTQLAEASNVFTPSQQFVPSQQFAPSQQYVPASTPQYLGYPIGSGGFPREWIDNGSRGAAAAYGGGGW